MDPEAYLLQNAPGPSFRSEGVPQQQHQQQHDGWQSSSLTSADGLPSASSANQYQIPSPQSPTDAYYQPVQQQQQHSSQPPIQQDSYNPTGAMSSTRPSTGLSLNIASLSVESATSSPLTGAPSPFTMHAGNHLPLYTPSSAGSQQQQYASNEGVFTFAAPSPKPEWQDHHPIGRSQSSSALLHNVATPIPLNMSPLSHYPPNTLRPSSSMSSIHEHDHNHSPQNMSNRQPHPNFQRPQYPQYAAIQRPQYPQESQLLQQYPSFSSSTTDDLTPNANNSMPHEYGSQSPQNDGDYQTGTPIEPDDEFYGPVNPPRSSSGSSEPFDDPATFRSHGSGGDGLPNSQDQPADSGSPGGASFGPSTSTTAIKREASQMDSAIPLSSSSSASGMTVGATRPGTSRSTTTGSLPTNNFVAKLYT